MLHYNNPIIGGGLTYSSSVNHIVLFSLQSVAVCAVDLFMLISGYFMVKSDRRNLWKTIELIVQVIAFQVALYLLEVLLGQTFFLTTFIRKLLPANYFVILYCVVFVVSPYVGFIMKKLSKKTLTAMICLLLLCFSAWPTTVDFIEALSGHSLTGLNPLGMYGDGAGYTFVNFLLCWMIGGYIRVSGLMFSKRKSGLAFLCVTLLIGGYAKLMLAVGAELEYAFSYCSPLVIFESATIFMLFNQIHLGQNRIINTLAKGAFTVYLLNNKFLTRIKIENFVKSNMVTMLIHLICSVVIIYLVCWCIYFVYNLIMSHVWSWLKGKIDMLDIGIVNDEG